MQTALQHFFLLVKLRFFVEFSILIRETFVFIYAPVENETEFSILV